jgi:hypothetical protein
MRQITAHDLTDPDEHITGIIDGLECPQGWAEQVELAFDYDTMLLDV